MRRAAALVVGLAVVIGVVAPATPAGAVAPPKIRTSTMALDFGWTALGAASPTQVLPIANQGPGTATGLTIGTPTDPQFEQTGTTCGDTLAAGATCTVTLRHRPTDVEDAFATLTVSTATGGAFRVELVGRPDLDPFPVTATPTGFDFGPTPLQSSATRETWITNATTTTQTVTVAPDLPSGPFSVTGTTCSGPTATLGSGQACSITWTFTPTAAGRHQVDGSLAVQVAGDERTYPVELRGHGGPGGFPLRVDETFLDFGSTGVGGLSSSQGVIVTNTSTETLDVDISGGAVAQFNVSQDCSFNPLPPGGSCGYTYRAAPTKPGLSIATAQVGFIVDGVGEEQFTFRLQVVGVGSAARIHATPTDLRFGPGEVGVAGTARTITVVNSGTAEAQDLEVATPTNPDYDLTTDCPDDLAAGATCTASIVWTPSTLADLDDGEGSTTITWLSGQQNIRLEGADGPSVHEAFVTVANELFIGGAGDGTGAARALPSVAQAVAALDAGTLSRRGYVTQLATSPEWITELVQDLYRDTLGREGDPGGVTFWVNRLRTGRNTVAQVAAQFYASSEYYNGFGEGDDTVWVTDLYRKLLGRSPDAGGLAYWVGQTASKGRPSVSGRMFQSPESRRTRVRALYRALLLRDPDPSGLAYWSAKVLTTGDIALATDLSSSAEFLRLAQYVDF